MRQLRWLAAAAFAASLIGAAPRGTSAADDAELVALVDARVAEWRISDEDRRFDEIGWSREILEACRLAEIHDRPVFLFTHDGRMAIGRC